MIYNIITPQGKFNMVPVQSSTYLTAEAQKDLSYMEHFKARSAQETIRSIAQWLEDHPEAVEVTQEYDVARNATRFDTIVRFMVKEK